MRVNYATTQNFSAFLNSSFGLQMAQAYLGLTVDMLEAFVGRYSRGKRKGQLRGAIAWKRVTRGGWSHEGFGGGHVKRPGGPYDFKLIDAWTGEEL